MQYSVIRRRGAEETATQDLEAASAVRLMRDWSRAYPQQHLVIRDANGAAVAYRRPAPASFMAPATHGQPHYR